MNGYTIAAAFALACSISGGIGYTAGKGANAAASATAAVACPAPAPRATDDDAALRRFADPNATPLPFAGSGKSWR